MYCRLGQLAAMNLVQGGCAFHVLSPSVYRYLCGTKLEDTTVQIDEVCDAETVLLIEEVCCSL